MNNTTNSWVEKMEKIIKNERYRRSLYPDMDDEEFFDRLIDALLPLLHDTEIAALVSKKIKQSDCCPHALHSNPCPECGCNGAPQSWKDALIFRFSKDINYLESHIGSDMRIELPAFVERIIAKKDEAIEKLGKLYAEKCSELASAREKPKKKK